MELSHVISDAVLTAAGVFVFLKFLLKLDLIPSILWESFILSITAAAFFGTLRFAGFSQAFDASVFFQHLAATAGAVGLVAASFSLVFDKTINKNTGIALIAIGFVLFMLVEGVGYVQLVQHIPLFAIPIVLVLGIIAFLRNKPKAGLGLVLGVVFIALATFKDRILPANIDPTDAYHYLVAISLLCFGFAAKEAK